MIIVQKQNAKIQKIFSVLLQYIHDFFCLNVIVMLMHNHRNLYYYSIQNLRNESCQEDSSKHIFDLYHVLIWASQNITQDPSSFTMLISLHIPAQEQQIFFLNFHEQIQYGIFLV